MALLPFGEAMHKLNLKLTASVLIAAMFSPAGAHADPSASAQYLMNHQASEMDLGSLRLGLAHSKDDRSFESQAGARGYIHGEAIYIRDTNRIMLNLIVHVHVRPQRS
jgi:hypothetical protein